MIVDRKAAEEAIKIVDGYIDVENKEKFFKRLSPFHVPSVLTKIELAYLLTKAGHQYDFRKQLDENGKPIRYFEHCRSVALILMDEANIHDDNMVITALFHDTFEDSRNVTPQIVEQFFGPDVCKMIKTLSKTPSEGYIERFKACKDYRPYVIKACDRLHNLRTLIHPYSEVSFQIKQVKETKEKYFDLFERMVVLSPDEYKENAMCLRDKIREIVAKHETKLGI
jgi:(p)ppGpp synthase/HD superfamily hydrolase